MLNPVAVGSLMAFFQSKFERGDKIFYESACCLKIGQWDQELWCFQDFQEDFS